ncbi:hypothetical protein CYLTODRAFT_424464 [Cylindrobasidium torrendii FP15055 ss-10]|uniref:Uncharacterized protein n=1 Tax=Cylindrobasidium torrendii FP15055 ss-10 TaxID=1314674 RepID=A0A0D7B423_9AGAR|nr:hypothetical protein CYLTODRAFT_424464 [Cylindrobasidium torrendii FP15055 ss-10]
MEATSSCGVADSAGGKFLVAQVTEPVKVGSLMLSHPSGDLSGSERAQTPPSSELSTLIGEIMESPGLEYPDPFDEIMEAKEQPPPAHNATSVPSPRHTHAEPSLRFTLPPPTIRIPPPMVTTHDAPPPTTYSPLTEEMPRISHYNTKPASQTSFHFAKNGRKVPKSGTSTAAAMKIPTDAILLQNPYPNPQVNIRLCMRNGCGSILTDPHAAFCQRCVDGGFVTAISKHYRNKPSRPSNHYRAPKPGQTTSSVTPPATPLTSRGGPQAPQTIVIPSSRVESRPGVVATPCQPVDASRSPSSDQLPLNTRSLQQPFEHQSAQRRITAPVARKCATPTCDRPVDIKARAVRCASCIKADWKTKLSGLKNTAPITSPTTPHVKKEFIEAFPSALLPTPPPTAISPCAASETATRTSVKRKLEHAAVPPLVQHSDTEDDDISSASRPVSRLDLNVDKGNEEDTLSSSLSPAPMSTPEPPAEFASNDSEAGGNVHDKPAERDPPLRERLFIRLPARPANPKKRCNIPKCRAELEDGYKWKLCRACRDHHRAYQRERLGVTNPSYTIEKERTAVRPSAGSIRLYASSSKQRICGFKGCGVGLPPLDEYKYKMCRDCRRRTTNSRRRRTLRESGQPPDIKLEEEKDRLIAKWRIRKKAVLDEDLEEVSEQEKGGDDEGELSEDLEQDFKAQRQSELGAQPPALRKPVQWERPASLYPEYPTLPTLLVDFSARISSFFKAHRAWMTSQSAIPQPQSQKISTFGFDGEFSTINMNIDIMSRREPVIHYIEHLKGELVRAGRVQLDTEGKQVAFAHGGILTRYRGAQWIGESWMTGEMEIAILPDTSHPYLHGQRTVIRYRLVG